MRSGPAKRDSRAQRAVRRNEGSNPSGATKFSCCPVRIRTEDHGWCAGSNPCGATTGGCEMIRDSNPGSPGRGAEQCDILPHFGGRGSVVIFSYRTRSWFRNVHTGSDSPPGQAVSFSALGAVRCFRRGRISTSLTQLQEARNEQHDPASDLGGGALRRGSRDRPGSPGHPVPRRLRLLRE